MLHSRRDWDTQVPCHSRIWVVSRSERAVSKMRLRKRRRESKTLGEKKKKGRESSGGKETESPEILQHRLRRRSQSPQLTNYLGKGGCIDLFKWTTLCALEILSHTMEDPVMEAKGLNNLEQYFTIIYTMSFPNHMLHCIFIIVQNPKPQPLC